MGKNSFTPVRNKPGLFRAASGVIHFRGTIDGERARFSTGKTKVGEAEAEVEKRTAEKRRLETLELHKKWGIKNPSLESLWEVLVTERAETRSESTLETYYHSWAHKIGPFWGHLHCHEVSQEKVMEFEKWFNNHFPTHRFYQTRKHLNMLLNWLHQKGYIKQKLVVQNLDRIMPERAKHQTPHRVYTKAEAKALTKAAPSEWSRVAMIIYFNTGMRKMELLSRKWSDVNFDEKFIHTYSSKNKKWRDVPLTSEALRALESLFEARGKSEYLFPMKTDRSRHISGQLFDKDWAEAKRRAGIKGQARVHDIRHTFATKTALDGWPVPFATTMLDMSAKEYTTTYCHITKDDVSSRLKMSFGGGWCE